ncbi:hypothetical protein QTP88_012096 [Uroleucon formosanum]
MMTVLTSPSISGKSGKESLSGNEKVHHDQTQPPPPYNPKLLETGDGGLLKIKKRVLSVCSGRTKCVHQTVEYRRLITKMIKMTAIVFTFLLVFYFAIDTLCKAYVQGIQKQQDTEDDAAVPRKSYSSYADAESDMLLLPESSPLSSKNMVINPAEGVIKKVPQFTIKDSASFFHDFASNITTIVDSENQHCYIMPLLRTTFKQPESMYDLLFKMSTRYYSVDISHILNNFHMVKPAITNISDYSSYIAKSCADYPTFKLERDIATDSP